MNYDDKMKRLEEIVNKLEKENISLADSVELYKEGSKLSKEIQVLLEKTEGEILKLSLENDQLIKEEFNLDE